MSDAPYSLSQLHDIVEPAAISNWPPAAGFWFLLALLLLWLSVIALILWQRHRRNRYRRLALTQLQRLTAAANDNEPSNGLITAIGVLLKRTALAAYPRRQVATLSGDAWLQFLNCSAATDAFSSDAAQLLISAPYHRSQSPPSNADTSALIRAAQHWIRHHRLAASGEPTC